MTTIINAGERQGRREVRGAIRYRPEDLLEPEHLVLPIAHDEPIVVYAEHGPNETLENIAAKLRQAGYADVRVSPLSLEAHERAGGETQEPSIEQVVTA